VERDDEGLHALFGVGPLALAALARRTEVRLAALWLSLAAGLAVVTSHVHDWYVMTDELFYERLAISVAHGYSPLPRVHGQLIANVNQLYPLLLGPLYHDALVPAALQHAHVLNAFVMSSASIPSFLLARRVTRSTALSFFVAFLSVCVPWITLSSFLMTEVVAYPAFLWAVLALQNAAASPSRRGDLLLIGAVAVATLARTQFAVFVLVVPVALFACELAVVRRIGVAARGLVTGHRLLTAAYAALAIAATVLLVAGRLSSALGTYSVTAQGNLVPAGMGRSLIEHLAPLAVGLGILPFVLGLAWLVSALAGSRPREQRAFAAVALATFAALLLEVTSYDLRFGRRTVHDRYLFYVAPLVLVACAAALRDRCRPRLSLAVSFAIVALAFSFAGVTEFDKLNVDSPVAVVNGLLLDIGGSVNGARICLVLLAAIGVVLLILVAGRRRLAAAVLLISCATIPAQTALAFTKLLTRNGTSGRPITLDQGRVFDWIDRELGPGTKVTMVPYPLLYNAYWSDVAYWWNVEFWNISVQRAALYEDAFTGTPGSFPKIELAFNRANGKADASPSAYSVQGISETRFQLAGRVVNEYRGAALIRNELPWRVQWLSFDLYRDGWTIPRVTGRIRVFAGPAQTQSLMRFLTISVRAPQGVHARRFTIASNSSSWTARTNDRGVSNQISVCVPAGGFSDVTVRSRRFSPIYGDPRSEQSFFSYARSGGVMLTGIALADETRPCS
jgi:hypothetical protein